MFSPKVRPYDERNVHKSDAKAELRRRLLTLSKSYAKKVNFTMQYAYYLYYVTFKVMKSCSKYNSTGGLLITPTIMI